MTNSIIAIMAIIVAVTVLNLAVMYKSRNKETMNYGNIIDLFDKGNISNIEYIRNKIVVTFKSIEKFNVEALKEVGAKGINVIGDKLKFFVSDDNKKNEEIYKEINKTIEG